MTDHEELPLELLSIHTPKGAVRHLVSVETDKWHTLCGRQHGVNDRYIYVGSSVPSLGPAESATCSRCLRIARAM